MEPEPRESLLDDNSRHQDGEQRHGAYEAPQVAPAAVDERENVREADAVRPPEALIDDNAAFEDDDLLMAEREFFRIYDETRRGQYKRQRDYLWECALQQLIYFSLIAIIVFFGMRTLPKISSNTLAYSER